MCTHSFTTEYDPAPKVFPVLYLHGWTCAVGGFGAAIVVVVRRPCVTIEGVEDWDRDGGG